MSGGIQFMDIILFAMIAAFLVFRLHGVLGRRDGHDGSGHRDPFKPVNGNDTRSEATDDNIIKLPDRAAEDVDAAFQPDRAESAGPEAASDAADPLGQGLIDVRMADPDFTPDGFLNGARVAFEMVLGAYAAGDGKTLRGLLDDTLFAEFEAAIRDREENGYVVEDTLVGIRTAEIVEAFMEDRTANVTAKFVSEQVNVTRDAEGQVADGNPNEVITVTDFWTFARDTKSRDPNWTLVATHSAE